MAACGLSSLCVGRHAALARTRTLAISSQWPSSSSRPASGAWLATPPSSLAQSLSTQTFSTTPALESSTSVLSKAVAGKEGGSSSKDDFRFLGWDMAAMSSLAVLAASGAIAMSDVPSCASAEPRPMATSAFASPSSPLASLSTNSSNEMKEHQQSSSVRIRRNNVRRRGAYLDQSVMIPESTLPARFHYLKMASECEGAYQEDETTIDILGGSEPYQVSIEAFQGRRETMEDEVTVNGGGRFAAVFDGHGGGDVSLYLKRHLYHLFLLHLEQKHWEEYDSDVQDARSKTPSIAAYMAALRQAFHSVETEIVRHSELNFVGSTACAVVLHENPIGYRTLISCNVGDSRAVLSRNGKAVDLTKDHKPTLEAERKRILRAGGRIFLDETGVHRVMNLSLSRAIGDGFSKPIVSPEPDIRRFRLEDGDDFIMIASDGLWDVMSSQDAVDFANRKLEEAYTSSKSLSKDEQEKKVAETRKHLSEVIVQEAMRLGSADNTSVVMVWLQD